MKKREVIIEVDKSAPFDVAGTRRVINLIIKEKLDEREAMRRSCTGNDEPVYSNSNSMGSRTACNTTCKTVY